MKALKSV